MRFDVLTLFPEIFSGYLTQSILKLALDRGLVSIHLRNIRDWATSKHNSVDDRPFGGGPGMVLMCEPVFAAIEAVTGAIEANLALIQRDDGALANGSITYDSLSASLQTAGMAPATPWGTGTFYAVGNNVFPRPCYPQCSRLPTRRQHGSAGLSPIGSALRGDFCHGRLEN